MPIPLPQDAWSMRLVARFHVLHPDIPLADAIRLCDASFSHSDVQQIPEEAAEALSLAMFPR